MEKDSVVVVSDKSRVGLRLQLKEQIEQSSSSQVVLLSRLKISRIRREIVPKNPTLVFITASLDTSEEFKDLLGFVGRLRKHLPRTKIIVHTHRLSDSQRKRIRQEGADGWIDDKLGRSLLAEGS